MLDKRKFYINGEWVLPSKPSDFEVINRTKLKAVSMPPLKQHHTINFKKTSNIHQQLIKNEAPTPTGLFYSKYVRKTRPKSWVKVEKCDRNV